MATDVGSAVGYLDLDISKFLANLKTAQSEANGMSKNIATSVGNSMTGIGKSMTSAGSTLTKGITVPIVGAGTAIIKTSANFESAMSKVSAISGATGSDYDKLKKKAEEMGAKTKFSATESAEAFQYMAMAGWKTGDMLDGIEGIMSLAAADGLDLATTSDIVTDALTAFGLKASDSGHFADVLAKASSNANTNVSMLGESFKYVAPVAGALGYSAEDTAIALGLMANSGIKASQGGTALRTMMTNMVKPTDAAAAAMKEYGLSMTNSDGTMKTYGQVMDMLREKLGGLDEATQAQVATTIFGKEAMSGALAIINASDKDYQSLTKAIYSADGAANQMAETMLNNLNGQITLLKSALEGLAIQFGEILLPYLKKFVTFIQELVQKLQNMTTAQKESIVKWAAFAAAIGPALMIIGKITTGVGGFITTIGKIPGAISTVKGGITSLVTGFRNIGEGVRLARAGFPALAGEASSLGAAIGGITAPIAAVIAIIAVLVAAFVTLWKTNEDFRNKIIGIWNGITSKFKEAGQKITEAINSLGFNFKDITEVIKAAWEGLCNFLGPIFIGVFEGIATTIKGIIDVVTGVIQVICGIIKGFKDGDWTLFLDGLKTLFTGFINFITAPFQGMIQAFVSYLEMFGTTWNNVWTGITEFFVSIWNGIKDFFSLLWETMKEIFTSAWNAMKEFFAPLWESLVNIVSTAWETIKNVITVGIMLIGEIIKAAFEIITLPFRLIWENCKEIITTAWEAIKTTVSAAITALKDNIIVPAMNAIKQIFTTIWNAIKTFILSVWNAIKSNITSAVNAIKSAVTIAWNGIKSVIQSVMNAIKSIITNIWNSIKSVITSIMNAIKSVVSNVWNNIKSIVSRTINSVKSVISSGLNSARSAVSSILNSIKSKFSSIWEGCKSIVSNAINRIKSLMHFSWELPHLKLPHFSISGRFSLNPPSVPSFGISWYKKAMDNGMILNSPTLFGFDPKTGKFLGGGEAGSETVVGTQSLMSMIAQTVSNSLSGLADVIKSNQAMADAGDIVIPVYIGNEMLDTLVVKAIDRNNYRNGGR